MPKYSPYKEQVNEVISRVLAGGFIERWLKDMNEKAERRNRQVKELKDMKTTIR